MKNAKQPIVSVIIVNYNGKDYLGACLQSLAKQTFPQKDFEIIVVDNNSTDNTISYVQKNHPDVILVRNNENLGFAGGNNIGVSHARGRYIALLNNDTKADQNWLKFLVQAIEQDSAIATVNSKALLFYPFVQVEIASDTFMRSDFTTSLDFQSVGVAIEEVGTKHPGLQRMIQYYQGFYKKENDKENQIPVRWTSGKATLLLPIDPNQTSVKYFVTVRSQKSTSSLKTNLQISAGTQIFVKDQLDSHEVKQYTLELKTAQLKNKALYEVQNAGNVVFKSGHSRDRGAVVHKKQQYFEIDSGYFNVPSQIAAFCGVSVIIRKKVFEQVGGFDESFFMYYEDVDLSLRLRRLGYKLRFEPKSVLYHIHAGSSGEWSPLFMYNVEKNHLAVVAKHFPSQIIAQEILRHLGLIFIAWLKMVKWRLTEHWSIYEDWKERLGLRKAALGWFIQNWSVFRAERKQLERIEKVSISQIYESAY